jgi:hypothetical protein
VRDALFGGTAAGHQKMISIRAYLCQDSHAIGAPDPLAEIAP